MSMSEMTNELIMMQQLSGHPNIVTVKEFFTEDARARHLGRGDSRGEGAESPGSPPLPATRRRERKTASCTW